MWTSQKGFLCVINLNDIHHSPQGAWLGPVRRSDQLIKLYYSQLWNALSRTVLNWRMRCRQWRKWLQDNTVVWHCYCLASTCLCSEPTPSVLPEVRAHSSFFLPTDETIMGWNLIQTFIGPVFHALMLCVQNKRSNPE